MYKDTLDTEYRLIDTAFKTAYTPNIDELYGFAYLLMYNPNNTFNYDTLIPTESNLVGGLNINYMVLHKIVPVLIYYF